MIAPAHVLRALNEGDIPAVQAYLDEGGNVNAVVAGDHEIFCAGDSLLMAVAQAPYGLDFTPRHIALAKLLVQHGADVNHHPNVKDGYTALHCCIDILIHNVDDADRAIILEMLGVLVTAGANANLRNAQRETPLGMALQSNYWDPENGTQRSAFESVKLLLRAGASLDACRDVAENDDCTAEEMLRKTRNSLGVSATGHHNYADDEYFVACEQLVSDVRAAGSWKQYVLHMPKALLRLRSLVARGRAQEKGRKARTRGKTPREVVLLFAPTFPNELFWRVLEYWNPRYEALRTPSPRPV
jgi:hypothetical protein